MVLLLSVWVGSLEHKHKGENKTAQSLALKLWIQYLLSTLFCSYFVLESSILGVKKCKLVSTCNFSTVFPVDLKYPEVFRFPVTLSPETISLGHLKYLLKTIKTVKNTLHLNWKKSFPKAQRYVNTLNGLHL